MRQGKMLHSRMVPRPWRGSEKRNAYETVVIARSQPAEVQKRRRSTRAQRARADRAAKLAASND